jgi:hypothetical protein
LRRLANANQALPLNNAEEKKNVSDIFRTIAQYFAVKMKQNEENKKKAGSRRRGELRSLELHKSHPKKISAASSRLQFESAR